MLPYAVKGTLKVPRAMLQRLGARQYQSLSLSKKGLLRRESSEEYHQQLTRSFSLPDTQANASQDEETSMGTPPTLTNMEKKAAAMNFNSYRATYRRQVSLTRQQYFDELARSKAAEEARLEAEKKEVARLRLERQRLKNVRSARNALRGETERLVREERFKEYLKTKQEEREKRQLRYEQARAMVVAELEAEADLWLTTPAEVEAAFSNTAEQMLWARPNGVLGSSSPSVDSHFWQYESHTMHMDKMYKTSRELLLDELMEQIYEESTVDEAFWTQDRLRDQRQLEKKARLRALVRAAGRRAILERQKEMLEKYFGTADDEVPKLMPAPDVRILANIDAQEKEGAALLLKDPTKFFRFENETSGFSEHLSDYHGPSRGSPIGLKDSLRDGKPWADVFPIGIAKQPKADTRTQREKKRQEREQRMWEAVEEEKRDGDAGVLLAASDDLFGDEEEAIDYDSNSWDSDDEEWETGLDPIEDAALLGTPPEQRYTEEDIRWVIGQLNSNSEYLQSQMSREVDSSRQRLLAQRDISQETAEEKRFQDSLMSLTNEQVLALVELDSQNLQEMSPDELSESLSKVPGLNEELVKTILELEDSLGRSS